MTIYRPFVEESELLSSDVYETEATVAVGDADEAAIESLATELLAVTTDQELDQFLGSVVKTVSGALKSPIGKALVQVVRPVASTVVRHVIPKAATAIGSAIGGPVGGAAGMAAGAALNALAGKFGLEIEGLSEEDQTFEIAKRFVSFLKGAAANLAAVAPQAISDPQRFARNAAVAAARQVAPGFVPLVATAVRPGKALAGAARVIRIPSGPGRVILELM